MKAAIAALLVAGCTGASSKPTCNAGIITGDPSLTMGRGSQAFIAVQDGDTWTAANGPQGGSHLWFAMRSTGIGPNARLAWHYEELDGGTIAITRGNAALCASGPTTQETHGLTAFLPDEPSLKHRVTCEGPFVLHVVATDEGGHDVEDRRVVGGVAPDPDSFIPFHLHCDAGVADGG